MSHFLSAVWTSLIEYETPRLVKIHNRKVGLVRRLIQLAIIVYVAFYALWLQKGYQEFGRVESSVTTKIKGVTKSQLDPGLPHDPELYTRVWDVADYVIPPAENGAFFVATNVIITPNQTRGRCPEDNFDVKKVTCKPDYTTCDPTSYVREKTASTAATTTTAAVPLTSANARRGSTTSLASRAPTAAGTKASPTTFLSSPRSNRILVRRSASTTSFSAFGTASTTVLDDTAATTNGATATSEPMTSSSLPPLPAKCRSVGNTCREGAVVFKAHGPLTGFCVPSDRPQATPDTFSCEVESWCPIEIDSLPLGRSRALMVKAEDYTVFVKNSIAFPYFGPQYVRNNLIGNEGRPCLYRKSDPDPECQIFRLGDMVEMAGGNFSLMAIKGGVVSLSIAWHCNLDYDFMKYCLPKYSFSILDDFGWNFRHAHYHEEHRRTLYKMYGIKFIINIEGRGGKFNLKNTILNVGSGLALLGVTTVVCDFLLMYIKERRMIKQKKYDYVDVTPPREDGNKAATNRTTNGMNRDTSMQPMIPRDVSNVSTVSNATRTLTLQSPADESIELH